MKRLYKLYISTIIFLIAFSGTSLAQTPIYANDVPTTLCANESFTLSYNAVSNITLGATVTAQLSDALGSFASPTFLGSESSDGTSAGTIYSWIPNTVIFGTTYRVRVITTGFDAVDNGSNININCTTRDYYWLGGAGNWSDLNNWEWTTDDITYTPATELPTATDNVIFDDTTFPSGGQLTVDVEANCNDFYWDPASGINNPVIWSSSSSNSLNVYGDFEMAPGVYRDVRYLYFHSVKHNVYLDFADNLMQFDPNNTWYRTQIYFYGNGSFDLNSDLVAYRFENYNSTFYTNDYTIELDYRLYNGNTFYAGASNLYARYFALFGTYDTETSNLFIRPYNNSSDLSLTGAQTHNNVTIDGGLCTVSDDNTFQNLTLINGGGMNISSGTHQVINGSFVAQGTDRSTMATIKSNNSGVQHTINIGVGGTVLADFVNITDSEILGSGTPYSASNGIDGGNNLNWNISTLSPLEYYWVGGTGNWSDAANHWATLDGGSTMHPEGPGAIDNVNFTSSSFPGGGTVTIDKSSYISSMTWEPGSGTNNPVIYADYGNELTLTGDLTLDTGVHRSINTLNFDSSLGVINISLADNLGNHGTLNLSGGGVINLLSEFKNVNGWFYINDVTFNSNDNDVTFWGMQINSDLAIINWGNSNLYMDYYLYKNDLATVDYGTSTLFIDRPQSEWESEISGIHNFNNVETTNIARFHDANTFNSLTASAGGTISIAAGVTQTVTSALNLNGSRSAFAKISAFNGGNGILETTGATITADFVDISDNTVIPAQVTAISGVVANPDNNVGWNIIALPPLDFYWIGGAGNWSDVAHWANTDGGSTLHGFPPGPIDNAFFTSSSFPSGGTITLDQPVTVNNVTWQTGSGSTSPEFYADYGNRLTITGDFIMADGVQRHVREMTFDSSNGVNNIDMADNADALGHMEFDGGGSWDLQGDLETNWSMNLHEGTLNSNGFSITVNDLWIHQDLTTVNFGNSNIFVNWGFSSHAANPTIDFGTSNIYFDGNGGLTGIGRNGSTTAFNFYNVIINGICEVNNSNTFNDLAVNPGGVLRLEGGVTQTVINSLNLIGTRSSFASIEAFNTGNGILDVTSATVTADFVSIADNTASPSASAVSGVTANPDNNVGWIIGPLPALDFYWINGTGNWTDLAHWQTSDDGGTTFAAATFIPGPIDNVNFTSNSFPSGGTTTIDQPFNISSMTWESGSGANNPEIFADWGNRLTITGNMTMDNGVSRRINEIIFDSSNGINNINMADNINAQGNIDFIGGGIWELLSDISSGGNAMGINDGTLNTNGYSLTFGGLYIGSDLATLNLSSSNLYVEYEVQKYAAGATINPGTSTFYFIRENSPSYIGSYSINFANVIFEYTTEIQNENSFTSLTVNPGGVLRIDAGKTQTVTGALNLVGTRSALAGVEAMNTGNGIFDVTGATVTADFVSIRDNTIIPSAVATSGIVASPDNNQNWTIGALSGFNFYWIGGTGNWTDPAHWSYTDGGSANVDAFTPGTIDSVIFTSNSFPTIGQVTIDQPVIVTNMTWEPGSGLNHPVIFGDWGNTLTILGDFTLDDGVGRRVYELIFDSSNGTNTLNMGDNYDSPNGNFRFRGGGIANLASDLISQWSVQIEEATLNTNGYTLNLDGIDFQGQNPVLNLGSSDVYLRYYFNDWSNNSTFDAGTSTIYFNAQNDNVAEIRGNYPKDFNAVVVTGILQIEKSNTYNSLTVNPGGNLRLFSGSVHTINDGGSLNLIGSRTGFVYLDSYDYGTPGPGFINAPAATTFVNTDYISIANNTIDNGLLGTNVLALNAIDAGGNTGWDYSPIEALEFYWIGGSGDWTDITHWQTSDDGGLNFIAATGPPGAVDNVFFTTSSFPEGGTLTLDVVANCFNMTWEAGSGTNFPVLYSDYPQELIVHGSLQMADGVARNLWRINFDSDALGNTISMADNLYNWGDIDFNGSGEWTLLDSLSTAYLNLRGGILNTNDQPVYVQQQIYLDNQHTGELNLGSSNIYLKRLYARAQNLTFDVGTSTFNFIANGDVTSMYTQYPLSLYNVSIDGRAAINSSFGFNDLTLLLGTDLSLQQGSTQTISNSFTAVGSRGKMIQIHSDNAGATATLLVDTPLSGSGSATINVEYAIIQDNVLDNGDADPLTEQIAASSVDNGNNTGWDFLSSPLQPLEFYWVGGTGNWSDTTHWKTSTDNGITLIASEAPPGLIDNVFFTSNSFPASGTITLDQPAACNHMTWSDGSFKPTITGDYTNRLTLRGNLTIANGVNRFLQYIDFNSSGTNLITLGDNRYEWSEFNFRGGGTWSLLDSLSATNLIMYSGTLNTLNNPINLEESFNLENEGPISLSLGSSQIEARYIYVSSSANVTADIGTSSFTIKEDGQFWGDTMGFYDLTFKGDSYIYTDVNISNNLTLLPGGAFRINPNSVVTFGNLIANGTRPLPVTIESTDEGQPATISSAGIINASDIIIRDNNAIGGATFHATEAIDKGGNSGWTFDAITPIDFYWIGGSGDWSDITHWQTSTDGGSTFASASFAPGSVDNVFVDAIKTPASTINLTNPSECSNMTWTAGLSGSSLTGDGNSPLTIHGSLTLSAGVSNNLSQLIFDSDATGNTINLAGAGNQYGNMEFMGLGEWTMQDSLSSNRLDLRSGTLNTNGMPLNVSYLGLFSTNGTLNLGSSKIYVNTINGNPSSVNLSAGTSTLYLEDNATIYSSWVFNNVEIDGDVQLRDKNTFNEVTLEPGTVLNLGDTLTVQKLNAVGLRSRPITIKSTDDGMAAGIVQNGGVVLGDYLTIQDNNASGGALFVAQNSINNGNVTGWTINSATPRNYYWVGGTGKWSEFGTHWSNTDGGSNFFDSSPGPLDNVFFTSNSFPSEGILTLDFPISVNNMDWTGSTSSVSITDEGEYENTLTIGGSITLANGVSRDFVDLYLISNNTGNTINMADDPGTNNSINVQGSGEWTLTGPLNTLYLGLEGGTFYSGSNEVTTTYIYLYNDNVSYWGASNVTTQRLYSHYLDNSSTFNSETSTFNFSESGSLIRGNNRFFNTNISADTYFDDNNIIINANITGGLVQLNESQAFSNLTIAGGASLSILEGTTQTVNIALSLNGTIDAPVVISSFTEGAAGLFTVPATGTVTASYVHLMDNTANSGGATFNTTNSSDFGNVTGWNGLLSGQTIYFDPFSDQQLSVGDFNVNASSSSSLNLGYEIASGSATINGNTVTPTATGLIGITATQAGDVNFGTALPITRYIHIDATTEPNELGNMKEAKLVIGQPHPYSNDYIFSETTTTSPWEVAVSNMGHLAIAQTRRLLIWNKLPATPDVPADIVLGQPDFTTDTYHHPNTGTMSASTFYNATYSVRFSNSGKLIVADAGRILIWNTIPTTNGAPADVVVGQTGFATISDLVDDKTVGTGINSITTYYDEVSATEKLIICDRRNNRVLIYNTIPTTNGATADVVIGQSDFSSINSGNGSNEMNYPTGATVAPDGRLLIIERNNNRILIFNTIPTANGASADMVLGQDDFGLSDPGSGPNSLRFPYGISVSRSGKLAIGDQSNSRVLIYNSIPVNNTTLPDYVIGQPENDSNIPNYNSISGRSLYYPMRVNWDVSENLFVSDRANNRVLLYGAEDIDAPVASNANFPTTFVNGEGFTSEVTLTDRSGISSAIVRYRGLSVDPGVAYNEAPLTDNGNGTWSLPGEVHPDTNNEKLGMEYYILVEDGLSNSMTSGASANIQYNNGLPITNFGVGSTTESYRMFSVPLDISSPDAKNVFDEIMTGGTYDDTKFRLYSFPGGTGTSYTEYGDGLTNIDIGKGYFALSSASATVNSGQGTTHIEANPYQITLVAGWNMIGNPFNYNVLWADVMAASGLTAGDVAAPISYNGTTTWPDKDVLVPGEGYFVNASSNVTLSIPVVYNSSAGRIAGVDDNTNSLAEKSWEVRFLQSDIDGYDAVLGGVGMEENSIQSYDEHDRINPPPFAEQPKVEFNHPEFFQPSFRKDVRTSSDSEQWSFTYTAKASDDLDEIYWDNSYYGYSSPDIYLVDKTHFTVINMKEFDNYEFKHAGITKFEVHYGMNALEALLPDQLEVQTPFPNPFTEQVSINVGLPKADKDYKVIVAVYNTLGKQVATLTNGALDSGYYSFKWNGTNDSGNEVPNGIYAYRVMVKGSLSEVVSGKLMKE